MKSELKEVNVIRYLRPLININKEPFYVESNLGGITFVFHMNYETRDVDVRFSICSRKENFNKQTGINTALASDIARTLNIDDFRKLADKEGGFVDAYWQIVKSADMLRTLSKREQLLLDKLNDEEFENWRDR